MGHIKHPKKKVAKKVIVKTIIVHSEGCTCGHCAARVAHEKKKIAKKAKKSIIKAQVKATKKAKVALKDVKKAYVAKKALKEATKVAAATGKKSASRRSSRLKK